MRVVLQGRGPIQRHGGPFASCSYQDARHNHTGHGPDILVINQPLIKLTLGDVFTWPIFSITKRCTQRENQCRYFTVICTDGADIGEYVCLWLRLLNLFARMSCVVSWNSLAAFILCARCNFIYKVQQFFSNRKRKQVAAEVKNKLRRLAPDVQSKFFIGRSVVTLINNSRNIRN